MNFAAIATDILVPQSIMAKGSAQLSGFFAVCTLLPQVLSLQPRNLLQIFPFNFRFWSSPMTSCCCVEGYASHICSDFALKPIVIPSKAYRMFMYGCLASICSSALYFFSASPYVVILFMLIDRWPIEFRYASIACWFSITVHATSPLFNILLSEVIEEDRARNARG